MASKKKLDDCKTLNDFKGYAQRLERRGKCETEEGSNHFKISTTKGSTYLSRGHQSQQLSKGFISSLIKQFIKIGLAIWVISHFV